VTPGEVPFSQVLSRATIPNVRSWTIRRGRLIWRSMWAPRTAAILRAGLDDVQESASLDFKAQLPPSGKNVSIATDVAAMATDGGTIIYGVSEDKATGSFVATPIPLAGTVERITNVVQSAVGGWVDFDAFVIDEGDATGFLVVAIPPSPLAPHMVEVADEHRFYGRGPGGNVILGHGEIDRLYERRARWDQDLNELLDGVIADSPFNDTTDRAVFYMLVRAVVSDVGLRNRVWPTDRAVELAQATTAVSNAVSFAGSYDPRLTDLTHGRFVKTYGGVSIINAGDEPRPWDQCIEVLDDGSVRYAFTAGTRDGENNLILREAAVAQRTVEVMVLAGNLFLAGGYHGPVDIASDLLGATGAISADWMSSSAFPPPTGRPRVPGGRMRASQRVLAGQLLAPNARDGARRQIEPLLRVVRWPGMPDPFA